MVDRTKDTLPRLAFYHALVEPEFHARECGDRVEIPRGTPRKVPDKRRTRLTIVMRTVMRTVPYVAHA
jgi:hypothetical protein